MANYYHSVPQIKEFNEYDLTDLLREDLGSKNFSEVAAELSDIHAMLVEMINLSEIDDSVPNGIKNEVIKQVEEFNRFAALIKRYDLDEDAKIGFNQRRAIIQQVKNLYRSIFAGVDELDSKKFQNFLHVYNTLKFKSLESLSNDKAKIDHYKAELAETQKHATEILQLLQLKASEESVQDYASIFQNQANKHSFFDVSFQPLSIKIGNSQRWLIISVLLLSIFGYIIQNIQTVLPIDFDKTTSVVSIQLLTRLLLLSLGLYIITFSFKQYNIQNHLHTQNKHRQNTLNSFKLFIGSLDTDDTVTRNALMLEVAKAIYEAGQTGYLPSKDSGDSSSSIIELTRFVGQK